MGEKCESNPGVAHALQNAREGDRTAIGEVLEGFRSYLTLLRTILAGQLAQLIRRFCVTEARNIYLEVSIEQDLNSLSARLSQGLASPESSPSESVGRREQLTILANMLEQFPPDYRDVTLLRQIDRLSIGEISSQLGRSEDSIQKRQA